MRQHVVIFIFIILITVACRDFKKPSLFLHSLISTEINRQILAPGEDERNAGNFRKASILFDSLIDNHLVSGTILDYTHDNLILCTLLAGDSISAKSNLPHDSARRITTDLIAGIRSMAEGETGSLHFHQVRQALAPDDTATFEYFIVLELLGRSNLLVDGKIDSALLYLRKAAEMTKVYSQLSPNRPRVLMQLAKALLISRDEVSGVVYVNEALRQNMDAPTHSRCLILKGTLLRKLGYYDSARVIYDHVEKEIQQNKLDDVRPELLKEYALMAILQEDDTMFYRRMNELLSCSVESLVRNNINIDRLYGYFYYKKKDAEKSIVHYERAMTQFSRQRAPDLVLVMESFYALTEQYSALRKFDDAERSAFGSLVFNTPLRGAKYSWDTVTHPSIIGVTFNFVNYELLANVFLLRADEHPSDVTSLKKALTIYSLIDSIMLKQVGVVQEDALINFLKEGHRVYSGGIAASYLAYEKTRDTIFVGLAHEFMEKSKALIMYQDMLVRADQYFPEVPADFRQRELTLKSHLLGLRRNTAFQSTDMADAVNALEDYFDEMKSKYPKYFAAKFRLGIPSHPHFQQLSFAMRTGIVQYHVAPDFIYFLTYDKVPQFGRTANDSSLAASLTGIYEHLNSEQIRHSVSDKQKFMRCSNDLYHRLVAPLKLTNESLLVVPDGPLQYLPFELLLRDSAKDYRHANFLVKEHTLSYSHSLKTYELAVRAIRRSVKNILAYSHDEDRGGLVALPGTTKELLAIRQIFSKAFITQRKGGDVTRRQVLTDLQKPYDLVHIGLHASSSASDRLDNKIYCFDDKSTEANIYGYEIVPLTIQAQTIMLTSCRSAFGPAITGEGTFSLARAFKQAGVNNVISSLWNLSDQSTADISTDFYKYLSSGRIASESLTLAKRDYLSGADEISSHPYFWAAMICQGR